MSTSLIQLYKPSHQLVIYESHSGSYVEHYEILTVAGKQVLSEGKALTKKSLKKMLDLVLTSEKTTFATMKNLMPENILFYDPRPGKVKLIWYNVACERILLGINKAPVKAKLPAMLYMLDDGDLHVYMMKTGNKRPELKTPLFKPPLPNVYNDGDICMGSVKAPRYASELSELIKGWEYAFWGSKFSDNVWKKETRAKLIACIKLKTQFNNKLLSPMNKTLSTLIK